MSSYSRRRFLKLSLALPGLIALGGCASTDTSGPNQATSTGSSKTSSIIVVGAGISGLSAARTLSQAGYQVIILEARNRLGGRMWTSRAWPEIPVDLGGSWIHGTEGNPLTELARTAKIKTVVTDYENAWVYDAEGTLLEDEKAEEIDEWGEEVLEEAAEVVDQAEEDYPLAEAIAEVVDLEALAEAERQQLDFYLNAVVEQEWAADLDELSAINFDDGDWFEGDDVLFPNGYDQIIHYLAQGLTVHLEHVVSKIAYDSQGVTLTTNRGEFRAERAIITLPLGVLQRGQIEFAPALPEAKQEAIQTLGSGLLNKLYLRFPQAFWPKEPEFIGYISAKKGEWMEWLNLYHYLDQPVLLGFNAGRYGRVIEALSDEEIVAEGMAVLRTIYGHDIPQPNAWQITRWASDPFALGSYSYNAVGASVDHREALAKPVQGRLFFAGEATSIEYPATVHGAYLSGQREAERIMALD
jgi:monoamine oxidase